MAATLPDFTTLGGMPSPASGRAIATPNTTAIGLGLESLGNSIASTADTLQKTWNANKTADAQSAYLAFQASEDQAYNDATQKLKPEDAQGFAQSYFQGYQQRAKPFLDALPATVRPGYGDKVFVDGQRLRDSAQAFEHTQAKTYGLNTIDATINQTILPRARLAAGLPADDPTKKPTLDAITNDALGLIDANQSLTPAEKEAAKATVKKQIQTGFAQSLPPAERIGVDPAAVGPITFGLPKTVGATVDAAATTAGLDPSLFRRIAAIESGGDAANTTGQYKGLFQLSDAEFKAAGGGDIFNPADNARAAAVIVKRKVDAFQAEFGRAPTPTEIYLMHQQGEAGLRAHEQHPELPAWQNMLSTGEGQQRGAAWAKAAIWGNVPDDVKKQFPGGVDTVTSADFIKLWSAKVESGTGAAPTWAQHLDAIPYDSKVTIAQDGAAALVRQQTAANTAQTQQHQSWVNAVENAIQDNKFGLADVQSAYDSGQLTSATERQHFTDLIKTRDKEQVNVAAAGQKIGYDGPGKYVFSASNADDKKTVQTWYGAAAGENGRHLLDEQTPDLAGGAESMVGHQAPGNPNGPGRQAQAAAVYATQRTGIVPPQVVDQLQGGMRSADPGVRGRAFDFMSALTENYPSAVAQGFTEADQKLLERYSSLAEMMTPEELTKALNPTDPQTKTIHDQLVTEAKTAAANIDFLGMFYHPGAFGTPIGGTSPVQPSDPLQAVQFERDANSMFAESYADTYGDVEKAKKLTAARLRRKWGPTELGSGGTVLMAYPPEKYALPAPDGTFHWMDDQLASTVRAVEPNAQSWGVAEAPQTEAEVKGGQQPHYLVWYTKDGVTEFITGADGKPQPKRFDQSEPARLTAADVVVKQAEFAVRQAADIARQDAMAGDPQRRALPAGGAGQYLIPPDPGTIPDVQSRPRGSVPPDGSYADHWKPTTFNAPDAPSFDPKKPTAYRDQFGEWSVPDTNDYKGSVAPQDLEKMFAKSQPAAGGGLDFSAFGSNAANVQTVVEAGMAASGRTAQQVLDDPQYRAAIINKGWATEPQIDGIVNAPQRPKNSKDARVQDAAGQYGLPGVAPSDSPIGAVANIGGAVVGAAQNIWNGFTGSRVVQQFMDGWDNPQGINRKGKGDKLPVGPLPASPAAMSTAVEDFSDRKSFGAAYERYFQAPPTEGLTQEMIVAAAQRAQAKDAAAKAGKAASGGVEGLNAFLNLMLIINQGMADAASKKAGR